MARCMTKLQTVAAMVFGAERNVRCTRLFQQLGLRCTAGPVLPSSERQAGRGSGFPQMRLAT